jgi:hypothetical protein
LFIEAGKYSFLRKAVIFLNRGNQFIIDFCGVFGRSFFVSSEEMSGALILWKNKVWVSSI